MHPILDFVCWLRKVWPVLLVVSAGIAHAGAEEIFIRASQVGYRLKDIKVAIAFGRANLPDGFAVLAADTKTIVFEGKTRRLTAVKWGQFENHVELDFSPLSKPGDYVLRFGETDSFPFKISAEAYAALPEQLLEFMREQRCGYNPWLDAVCHPFDGRTAFGPLTNGTYLDARGGWHDAGDLL